MNKEEPGYKIALNQEDKALIEKVRAGDKQAFEVLFKRYYKGLCISALRYIPDEEVVEDLVQDMFFRIWEKRKDLFITTSLESYLYRSVHNLSINYLNHEKIKRGFSEKIIRSYRDKHYNDDKAFREFGLEDMVNKSIEMLPERRKKIFKMSRFENLKNQEIAKKMNVSIKTVEAQMTHAIRFLRDKLKDYSP